MKKHLLFIVITMLLLPLALRANLPPLPECYYTYDEVVTRLFELEDLYPTHAKVHMIGYSQQDEVPIYAMQLTTNVNGDWEKPALLFVGQVHAEEVLGVQITMSNIEELLANRTQAPYGAWLYQLDTWWIPTLNPEGHKVVTDNLDTSYRKNKHDTNHNGIFDYSPQVGYDIDGVDINRNFDFNFVHGDTLLQGGGNEPYDYYRGPSPMSESEVQAIKRLSDEKKFVYSICWHSSRTGNFSEKVYYSFNWKDVRPSPDHNFARSIAQGAANQIQKEGIGTYEFYPNASRQGAFHDWMYKQYGTIQLLIECGTRNLQPNETIMLDTVARCTNGVWWMLERAMPFSSTSPSNSLLTGRITDSVTGAPIEAEIVVQQRHAPWFHPRTSNPDTGLYYRPIGNGNYSLLYRQRGYWDLELPNVIVNNSSWTYKNVALTPKESAILYGSVNSPEGPISAEIRIGDVFEDVLNIEGDYIYHGFEGEYPITIFAEGYYPYRETITLNPGANMHHFYLSATETVFSEDWEDGISGWEIEGPWVLQNELATAGYAITDSWGGRGHYAQNCDVWIRPTSKISLPNNSSLLLYFDSHLYTEWEFDPVTIEVSPDGDEWEEIWRKSGRHDWWQKEYVDISALAGQELYFRFRLQDDSIDDKMTDPGWTIDNIKIVTGEAVSNEDEVSQSPALAVLYPNFPNPFNPETKITYSLGQAQDVCLDIYNVRGQLVYRYAPGTQSVGDHYFVWNGKDQSGKEVSSGVYFYRLKTETFAKSRKMILMK